MITLDDVQVAHTYLRRRFKWRSDLDVVGVEEALSEAAVLSAGHIEDEPAALLLALLRRPNDLRDAARTLPLVLTVNAARKLGYELRLDPAEEAVRQLPFQVNARDPSKRATLADIRTFLAERMHPMVIPPSR